MSRETILGPTARFLLPSLKLKQPAPNADTSARSKTLEDETHDFLLANFGGYTATSGNLFGFWDQHGKTSYGEHREFTISLAAEDKVPTLKNFLAHLAQQMNEECIYLEIAGSAHLIYAN